MFAFSLGTFVPVAFCQVSSSGRMPDFSLEDLDGHKMDAASFAGNFVVLHIATTWCPFCNAEAPHLQLLHESYQDRKVKVIIIDVKEPASLVREKLRDRFALSFPILIDPDGAVAAAFADPSVLPSLARDEVMLASNLIIDPEGNIQFLSLLDSRNFDAELIELRHRLDALLKSDQ